MSEQNSIVKIKWEEEVQKRIEEYFKAANIPYKGANSYHRSLIDFMNLDMKLVNPIPRTVFLSDKIKSIRIPPQNKKALIYIYEKIRTGQPVTYHQSKKTLDPIKTDDLLNDWVIHHFHLSDTKKNKGQSFYDRSDYLLFTIFSDTQAFFIDIRKHKEENVFSKQEFLEIIDKNWPGLLRVHSHPDAEFLNNRYSDEDIKILREKGYTIGTTQVNGKIIANPGIGITTSGHNIHVVRRADAVVRRLHETHQYIEVHSEEIRQELSKKAGFEIPELDFSITRISEWPFFVFLEKTCNMTVE